MRGWLVRSKENSGEYRISVLRAATAPMAAIEHPKQTHSFPNLLRGHCHGSLSSKEVTMVLHWWNLLEICTLALVGNHPSRAPGKAAHREASHWRLQTHWK